MGYIKKAEREEPYVVGKAKNIYQLFIKSRSMKWLIENRIFAGLEIRKLKIDGISIPKNTSDIISLKLKSCKYKIRKLTSEGYRFIVSSKSRMEGTNIDIKEVYDKLQSYNPKTLFIKEIELYDPRNLMLLLFRDKHMTDIKIRERIEKSWDTHSNPLFLQSIYDLKTIQQIKKDYFPKRKTTTILKTYISKENVMKFKIVENGK